MDIEYTTQYAAWNEAGNESNATGAVGSIPHGSGSVVDTIDLSYSVLLKGKYKRILRDVNIHVEAVCSKYSNNDP